MKAELQHRVDVLMPVRNGIRLVGRTVDSVRAQTLSSWRLFAVDDCSTDGTAEYLDSLALADQRIEVLRIGERRGACHARNKGLAAGAAPFVLFLDSDDLMTAECLQNRLNHLHQNTHLDFTLGLTSLFTKDPGDSDILWNRPTNDPENDLLRFLCQDMPWHTLSPLWRRKAVEKLGGWNENLDAFQDWEFHARACLANYRYELGSSIPDSFYRIHPHDGTAISSGYFSDDKVWARLEALRSLAAKPGFFDLPERRRHAAAFVVRNALQLAEQGFRRKAIAFLLCGTLKRLLPWRDLFFTLPLVARGKYWRFSRLTDSCLTSRWPESLRADPGLPVSWCELTAEEGCPMAS